MSDAAGELQPDPESLFQPTADDLRKQGARSTAELLEEMQEIWSAKVGHNKVSVETAMGTVTVLLLQLARHTGELEVMLREQATKD